MNALPLRAMTDTDLDAVLALEQAVYPFPWVRGHFADALCNPGYLALVLGHPGAAPQAYAVALAGVDEMHLLNITVMPAQQGRGLGLRLLDAVVADAAARGAALLWLEVRASNARAHDLYQRYGFTRAGWRRGYYPALGADGAPAREDAIVMSLDVVAAQGQRAELRA